MYTAPLVRSSSPARQCISVLLPDPDGPMIAVKRPLSNCTVTPSRARTSLSPPPYTFSASTAPAAAVIIIVCWLMDNVVVLATGERIHIRSDGGQPPGGAPGVTSPDS